MVEKWNGQFVSEEVGIPLPHTFGDGFERLLGMALRKNKKRAHLLVSTVLGKHIPQEPSIISAAAAALADQIHRHSIFNNANRGLNEDEITVVRRIAREKVIAIMDGKARSVFDDPDSDYVFVPDVTVFGYAETATSLGALVAQYLYSDYIHSTRYPVAGTVDYGGFDEEHSHATAHHITPTDVTLLNNPKRSIVLVDDELTTGNTVMNTIRLFESHAHHETYYIATLTDLRTKEAVAKFAEFEKELGIHVDVISLISTELDVPANAVERAEPIIERIKNDTERSLDKAAPGVVVKRAYAKAPANLSKGITATDLDKVVYEASALTDIVAPVQNEKVLVLGIEEDMFFGLSFADALQKKNRSHNIFFSSATRSPVVAYDDPGYAIRDRIKYDVEDDDASRYVYNVGQSFDRIIIVTDSSASTKRIQGLIDKLVYRTKVVEILEAQLNSNELQEPLHGPEFGSYKKEDVSWLLKDLSNVELEAPTEEREEAIQSGGAHYAESLPVEYVPTVEYQQLFFDSLDQNKTKLAEAIGLVSEQVFALRNANPVLVSLARAGTPVGVLMKRYLESAYKHEVPHYAVSIVRGKGIDYNALKYIAANHNPADVVFVDGWTGKGAITKELRDALNEFESNTGIHFDAELAVLADPGSCVSIYGTRDDYLIPSACLNSTVSGLISRTVLNEAFVGEHDYHGAKFYREFAGNDVSQQFIDTIVDELSEELFEKSRLALLAHTVTEPDWSGWKMVEQVSEEYGINNVNLVKPGVGETTRVLLRRVPWRILVRPQDKASLRHILLLAEQRGVEVEEREDLPYACIGLIHPHFTKGATGFDGGKA